MIRLTKQQTRIIYISLVILAFLIFFWIFVYGPQGKRLAIIKKELKRAEDQIAQVNNLIGGQELTKAVTQLKRQLDLTTAKLAAGEEDVIYNLSQEAENLNIEVRNIMPSGKKSLDKKVAGYEIEELPISMGLTCEFYVLGEYLNILRNDFPILVTIRKLDIKGRGEGKANVNLDITLEISAYLSKGN